MLFFLSDMHFYSFFFFSPRCKLFVLHFFTPLLFVLFTYIVVVIFSIVAILTFVWLCCDGVINTTVANVVIEAIHSRASVSLFIYLTVSASTGGRDTFILWLCFFLSSSSLFIFIATHQYNKPYENNHAKYIIQMPR